MIQTSYFGNPLLKGKTDLVAISQGLPRFAKKGTYESYKALAPSWDLVKNVKEESEYRRRYFAEVLAKLDPAKVAADLDGKILLCWEKPGEEFCHRRMVAEWLEESLGIQVPEADYVASKPKRPAKKKRDMKPLAAALGMQMVLPA